MSARPKRPTKRGHSASHDVSGMDELTKNLYVGDVTKPGLPTFEDEAPKIVAISMKTPAGAVKPKAERELPHIKLRQMSEMSRAQIPVNLGNLAPPYDPAEARKRTVREYIVWGSLAVILACGIALVIWFAAT